MIVYLARDIPAFVMYCVNGESGSSLLIESTDSMITNLILLISLREVSIFASKKSSTDILEGVHIYRGKKVPGRTNLGGSVFAVTDTILLVCLWSGCFINH